MEINQISVNSRLETEFISFINKYRNHITNSNSFRWQFSFLSDKNVITAINDGEKVFGTQCMMPLEINCGRSVLLSAKCENSYLDESLRGKNYFSKLFSFASELCKKSNIECLWAFTPAIKPYKLLGFKVYENSFINYSIQIRHKPFRDFYDKKKSVFVAFLKYYYTLLNILRFRVFNAFLKVKTYLCKSEVIIQNNHLPADEIKLFYDGIKEKYKNIVFLLHDDKYLKWRVLQNPNIQFRYCSFYTGKEIIGYSIYSVSNEDLLIHALLFSDVRYLGELILSLNRIAVDLKANTITYYGNLENEINKQIFGIFKKFSFRRIQKTGSAFVYRFNNSVFSEDIKESNWFINFLWTEGY